MNEIFVECKDKGREEFTIVAEEVWDRLGKRRVEKEAESFLYDCELGFYVLSGRVLLGLFNWNLWPNYYKLVWNTGKCKPSILKKKIYKIFYLYV